MVKPRGCTLDSEQEQCHLHISLAGFDAPQHNAPVPTPKVANLHPRPDVGMVIADDQSWLR